jgi:UDP-N-acetylmuramate--alanine ligase
MKKLDIHRISQIYLIGIGGIGMSALARYFLHQGKSVSGYDRVSTSLTDELIREGIDIHFIIDPSYIRDHFTSREDLLVIYTPAIPEDHAELEFFRREGYRIFKRAQLLGILTEGLKCIAVAGTHGKTTVSTMLTHLMMTAGIPCNAFLGGISKNYGSNGVFMEEKGWFILEADEYDRSFLNLFPDIAIITSCDPDHLDIYGNETELKKAFCLFISQIREGGTLVHRIPLELGCQHEWRMEIHTYSLLAEADYRAIHIRSERDHSRFDVETPSGVLKDLHLGIPGRINVENALAVISLSRKMGLEDRILKQALRTFRGVSRRLDVQIQREDMVYIDDYAHHPSELTACIESVKKMYPGRKITGVFQPHLFSRTKDFAAGFASSLQNLDELILLDIYPAREDPIPGITSGTIFDRIRMERKVLIEKEKLMDELQGRKPEVLLTLGAGDIDRFVEPIVKLYNQEQTG